jgi:hypothetical protein
MVVAVIADGAVRENDLGEVMKDLSAVVPANAGTHTPRPLDFGR